MRFASTKVDDLACAGFLFPVVRASHYTTARNDGYVNIVIRVVVLWQDITRDIEVVDGALQVAQRRKAVSR